MDGAVPSSVRHSLWPIDLLFGPVAPLAREVELVRKTSPSWGWPGCWRWRWHGALGPPQSLACVRALLCTRGMAMLAEWRRCWVRGGGRCSRWQGSSGGSRRRRRSSRKPRAYACLSVSLCVCAPARACFAKTHRSHTRRCVCFASAAPAWRLCASFSTPRSRRGARPTHALPGVCLCVCVSVSLCLCVSLCHCVSVSLCACL